MLLISIIRIDHFHLEDHRASPQDSKCLSAFQNQYRVILYLIQYAKNYSLKKKKKKKIKKKEEEEEEKDHAKLTHNISMISS